MKGDYLWDKSGEPDAEIQELEELLGTLRYQPRTFELPAETSATPGSLRQPFSPRRFFPGLAIAATILMVLLGVGIWLRFNDRGTTTTAVKKETAPTTNANNEERQQPPPEVTQPEKSNVQKSLQATAGTKSIRRIRRVPNRLTGSELAAAEYGKKQLLMALRVASSKLNLAQKKAQGAAPANLIRNQHKTG